MRRAHRLLAGLLAAGALLTATTGCAQSVDPIERLGRKAAQRVNPPPSRAAARPAGPRAAQVPRGDHGAPGALVVVSCGRPPRPGRTVSAAGEIRHGRHEGRELALRLTEC
ncbi:hypothetical protein ACFVQ0_10035 [Streptomyces sp. NPDC057900]|uniref:hypothetical protein n=1 Tax=Streptomyces sp. NPDC057900 TaxID=3346274 RepID=UPI0036EAF1E6